MRYALLNTYCDKYTKNAEDAISYVPRALLDSVKTRGLLGMKAIKQIPGVYESIAAARNEDSNYLKDMREQLLKDNDPMVLGPNIMFKPPPDLTRLSEKHPLRTKDLVPVGINLKGLLKDKPDTRLFGMELQRYGDFLKLPEDEQTIDKRRRFLKADEITSLTSRSADDLWAGYNDIGNRGRYAPDVPHAAVITPDGVLPPQYLKFPDDPLKTASFNSLIDDALRAGYRVGKGVLNAAKNTAATGFGTIQHAVTGVPSMGSSAIRGAFSSLADDAVNTGRMVADDVWNKGVGLAKNTGYEGSTALQHMSTGIQGAGRDQTIAATKKLLANPGAAVKEQFDIFKTVLNTSGNLQQRGVELAERAAEIGGVKGTLYGAAGKVQQAVGKGMEKALINTPMMLSSLGAEASSIGLAKDTVPLMEPLMKVLTGDRTAIPQLGAGIAARAISPVVSGLASLGRGIKNVFSNMKISSLMLSDILVSRVLGRYDKVAGFRDKLPSALKKLLGRTNGANVVSGGANFPGSHLNSIADTIGSTAKRVSGQAKEKVKEVAQKTKDTTREISSKTKETAKEVQQAFKAPETLRDKARDAQVKAWQTGDEAALVQAERLESAANAVPSVKDSIINLTSGRVNPTAYATDLAVNNAQPLSLAIGAAARGDLPEAAAHAAANLLPRLAARAPSVKSMIQTLDAATDASGTQLADLSGRMKKLVLENERVHKLNARRVGQKRQYNRPLRKKPIPNPEVENTFKVDPSTITKDNVHEFRHLWPGRFPIKDTNYKMPESFSNPLQGQLPTPIGGEGPLAFINRHVENTAQQARKYLPGK